MEVVKTIPGDKDIQVWVNHHNCHNSCKHCFLGQAPKDNILADTEETYAISESLGFDTYIYATDQASEDFRSLRQLEGCQTPNLQVRTDKIENNLQDPNDMIGVTVISEDPEIHDRITSKGHHARTTETIAELQKHGASFAVWTVVYADNYREMPEFLGRMVEQGANHAFINKLIMIGNGMNLPPELSLNADQIKEALAGILGAYEDLASRGMTITMQAAWGPLLTPFEKSLYESTGSAVQRKFCPGGKVSFGVDPVTKGVWICNFAVSVDALKIGHLDPEKGLVINQEWPFETAKVGEPCRSCSLKDACGCGCRGICIVDHLVTTGEVDLHAGFHNCPVHLGVEMPASARSKAESLKAFQANRGMSPYHFS